MNKKTANRWEHLIAPSIVSPKIETARLITPCAGAVRGLSARPRDGSFKSAALQSKRIALISTPGLVADSLVRSLRSLGPWADVQATSLDPIEKTALGADLIVLDAESCTDLPAAAKALHDRSRAPIALLTVAPDEDWVTEALSLGVATVIAKSCTESQMLDILRRLLDAAHISVDGHAYINASATPPVTRSSNPYGLTPGELDVLRLLAEGLTNQQIAEQRGSKEGTVKIHLDKIYKKLKVQNRTQAMCIAVRMEAVRDLQLRQIERGGFAFEALIPYVSHEIRRPGDVLFRRGERSDSLYYIRRGKVRLAEFDVELEDGGLLGEIGIFSPGHARTCTALCETQTSLFRLSADQAQRLYIENPRFAYHVVKLIAGRLIADQMRQETVRH
ncbi:MAG TPA: LuxR C-terminal-related transcriptional regulator [Burkholderiales bacterium]|nr:LuxR C-terminal-related transcriptional regulator [Burkholderiales bacterium]